LRVETPVKGSAVKIQTLKDRAMSIVSIELFEKIYKENKDIIALLAMFFDLKIGRFDDPEAL